MKTVTKEIKVYSVDDLRNMPELKEKVLEKYRDFNVDCDFWSEVIIEDWKEKLENYGFISPEICFSGFWSQGDGASFTCKNTDILVFFENFSADVDLTEKQKNLLLNLTKERYETFAFAVKRRNHHYCHENTVYVASEDCLYNFTGYERLYSFLESSMQKIENAIAEKVIEFSRQIYRELEKGYDYQTSETALLESFEANDLEFLEDGTIY